MKTKKAGNFRALLFFLLVSTLILAVLSVNIVSSKLDIKKETISAMTIPELNIPALFKLTVTNLNESDNFLIYSLTGIRIEPSDSLFIAQGETKEITISAYPNFEIKSSPYYYSFEYKFKGDKLGIQSTDAAITVVKLKDAFKLSFEDITPESKSATLNIENLGGHSFEKVSFGISSSFFSQNLESPVNAFESKKLNIDLDAAKTKMLLAGKYIATINIISGNISEETTSTINFNEKPNIKTIESKRGRLIREYSIEKSNTGNTKSEVTISITKNLFVSLFTIFNIAPDRKELQGLRLNYVFTKTLNPGESLKVTARTNWLILIGIIIAIIIIIYLVDKYIREKLILRKKVSIVRTKGGEFALKVTIKLKARDFVEKIRIFDRIPAMVKLFEGGMHGFSQPDKVDEKNRRLEWNINALSAGEERILSYVIYSKIGVMGKFELPQAEAIYEFKGKIKEAQSNTAVFENE